MMDDVSTLPVPGGGDGNQQLSTIAQLAEISEEQIWLQKQKKVAGHRDPIQATPISRSE
jgi:hypothetical protein